MNLHLNHERQGRVHVGARMLVAFGAACVLGACALGPEAARFENKPRVETFAVAIVAVDGAPVASTDPSAVLEPGPRRVTVQMPRAAGFKDGEQRTIDLDVKACTRYWLVASRVVGSAATDVVVDHAQTVYSCAARAGRASSASLPTATPR
jgi:hypothetical protein